MAVALVFAFACECWYNGVTMTGIQFVTDEHGNQVAVQIDLHDQGELWEDFHDPLLAQQPADEPRDSLDDVKFRLKKTPKN